VNRIPALAFAAAFLAPLMVPAQTATTRDTVVRFDNGGMSLEGTLTRPAGPGPWPAAVIIAGSGPTDRDGNSVAGVATDMYRLLAEGLAARGIASLRYDKRGLPTSRGSMNMMTTTLADFAADASSAARMLAGRPDVASVSFVGHSEGGTLAMLAAKSGAPVTGLVLVATAGRDPTTILREQLGRQLPPAMLAQFDTAWASYIRGDSVRSPPGLESLFVPVNLAFLQSWQAVDPIALLRSIELPPLIVQGQTDVQITVADARALASARPDAKLVILDGVNHVLKLASGSTAAEQMAVYMNRSLPLAPDVVPTIADFILTTGRR
jgi:pimeloyl-ACP methyl ester carboxylesterase